MTEQQQIAEAIKLSEEEAKNRVCVDGPPFGLRRHKIRDDGHCLFGAIGFFVGKDAFVVRKEICVWLETNIYNHDYKRILKLLLSHFNMVIDYKITPHSLVIQDESVKKNVKNYIKIMRKTDGNYESYGGEVEAMVAVILYEKTIILFFKNGESFIYKPYPFIKITEKKEDLILLFNCKLNTQSNFANHWEALTLDGTMLLVDILSSIPISEFRKVKSNRKVKTPLFTKKRYQKRII